MSLNHIDLKRSNLLSWITNVTSICWKKFLVKSFRSVLSSFKRNCPQCFFLFEGIVQSQYFLESDHHPSDRTVEKIDRITAEMLENGLYRFYLSMATYKQQLNKRAYLSQNTDNHAMALTLDQMKRPLIIYLSVLATAMIIFVIEQVVLRKIVRHHN